MKPLNGTRATDQKKPGCSGLCQPTKETLSDFALYQANQKTYEAAFLKTFVTHALNPDTVNLPSFLNDNPEAMEKIEAYLGAVASNVKQITNKMIWNAHFKCVNVLTNTGNKSVPFLDIDRFKQDLFRDFGPNNVSTVVGKMNQSWHRAYSRSAMVRYCAEDYPLVQGDAKQRSPIAEVEEAANTVINRQSTANELAKGRVFKLPSKRAYGSMNTPATSENFEESRIGAGNVIHDTGSSRAIADVKFDNAHPPVYNTANCTKDRSSSRSSKDGQTTHPVLANGDSNHQAMHISVPAGDQFSQLEALAALQDINRLFPDQTTTRLEALVAHSNIDTTIHDVNAHKGKIPGPRQDRNMPHWMNRVLEDHKRRLGKKSISPSRPRKCLPQNLQSVIARAVTKGILKPPTPETQAKIDAHAIQRAKKSIGPPGKQKTIVQGLVASRFVPRTSSKESSVHTRKSNTLGNKTRRTSGKDRRDKKRAIILEASGGKRKRAASKETPKKRHQATTRDGQRTNDGQVATSGRSRARSNTPRQKWRPSSKPREDPGPLPPHPSGSKTLEPLQVLPDEAYFEKQDEDEKPAWRCGIRHCLGYYYNAGDRKNCPGCFTHVDHNPKARIMDFYLPSMTHFRQPDPGNTWKPFPLSGKPRKSKHICHNGIGKEYYWEAINAGATQEEARKIAAEAVEEFLRPKTPPEPEPEPTPEPEPEPIDLGPHPSGSMTMEHGQGIPECHYFQSQERHEEFAWRCDGGHALGRYYMAGDKRSCPGCGLNKMGNGKRTTMDFYMPPGAVTRQEAPGLVEWRPRKPYKTKRSKREKQAISHNQICAAKYWDAIETGLDHEDALRLAIKETDAHLDARYAANRAVEVDPETERSGAQSPEYRMSVAGYQAQGPEASDSVRNDDGGIVLTLHHGDGDLSDNYSEQEQEEIFEVLAAGAKQVGELSDNSSSDDISSSSSDSE